jgi:ubiquinone/menaquinone biosynthesis C-methylase UbiE
MNDESLDPHTAAEQLRQKVRDGYRSIALTGNLTTATAPHAGGCCGSTTAAAPSAGGCCGPTTTATGDNPSCCGAGWSAEQLAQHIGYDPEQIKALPQGANMGLSCGNPTAIANLQPGQIVLDLGAGGGFDVFLAGPKVGPTGRVIGVDMTPEMLSKARHNIPSYRRSTGLDNVEFRLGEIEHLPIADASVDVVISNCVINLSPDKPQVWREIARVLKPGGTVAVSDMALLLPLPDAIRQSVEALVGCVAGAVLIDEYRDMLAAAGFTHIQLNAKREYTAALSSFKDPLYAGLADTLPQGTTAADFVTSLDVLAQRPR